MVPETAKNISIFKNCFYYFAKIIKENLLTVCCLLTLCAKITSSLDYLFQCITEKSELSVALYAAEYTENSLFSAHQKIYFRYIRRRRSRPPNLQRPADDIPSKVAKD